MATAQDKLDKQLRKLRRALKHGTTVQWIEELTHLIHMFPLSEIERIRNNPNGPHAQLMKDFFQAFNSFKEAVERTPTKEEPNA